MHKNGEIRGWWIKVAGMHTYTHTHIHTYMHTCTYIRVGADKSLARPGRKQATATKLGFIQHTPQEAQYTS